LSASISSIRFGVDEAIYSFFHSDIGPIEALRRSKVSIEAAHNAR
jgi:hypothetical protein